MVASKMIEAAYGNACAKRQMRLPSFKETHLRETGLCASLSTRRDSTGDAGEVCYQEINSKNRKADAMPRIARLVVECDFSAF